MPARMLPQALSQDATELDRQMGCMAGVFQIFDRRRLLTARQRGGGGGRVARSTLPQDHALPRSSSNVSVQNSATPKITLEKTFSRSMADNSSLSKESSRASSSSSPYSSFSPLNRNKQVQQELSNTNEELFMERPPRSSPSSKKDAKSRHASTGFRDTAKDSINRNSHGLALKTSSKEVRNGLHKDSPRPLLISKSSDGTYVIGIDRSTIIPSHESSRPPRFSCDDRQLLRPVEAPDSKKPSGLPRELPRLSLDSRKESMNPTSRLKKSAYTRSDDSLLDALKPQQSPSHRRASSIIVKLMGLEETPDTYEPTRSPRPAHATQNDRPSHSPRIAYQDHSVSQQKNQSSELKTKPSPINLPAAAPWNQQEGGVTGYDVEVKPRSASFYADLQRRLGALELSECNKDLRALRVLGALHGKDSPCQSETNVGFTPIQKAAAERTANSEFFQSPIVIMRPAKGITNSEVSLAFDAPLARPKGYGMLWHDEVPSLPRKNENNASKKIHSQTESTHFRGEELIRGTTPRSSSSSSHRLVQRKADSQRRSGLPVPPMSPSKKCNEAVSPRGRVRSKPIQAKSICSDNEVVLIPERKISLAKQVDVGVIDHPNLMNANSSFLHRSNAASTLNHEEIFTVLSCGNPLENIPSPVSVLDALFYDDGSSPSLKRISDSFKDAETHTSDECWNPTSLPDTPPLKTRSEGRQIKPENMEVLIQKLELLQLLSDEAVSTSSILPTVAANKDHQYIYEILSASGLLNDELHLRVMPHQLQPSSYSIHPELFVILDQAKPNREKLQRKIIFDLVNELINEKVDTNHSTRSKKLSGRQLFKGLCAEINRLQSDASIIRCTEEVDESMLTEAVVRGIKEWKSFDNELQDIVLDMERSIFKDLIDEVLSEKAIGKVQPRRWKLRRQLSFTSI